jgi:hypothetical protein
MSRIPHFLYNRLTDGGDVSLNAPTAVYSQEILSGTDFCVKGSVNPRDIVQLEGLGK